MPAGQPQLLHADTEERGVLSQEFQVSHAGLGGTGGGRRGARRSGRPQPGQLTLGSQRGRPHQGQADRRAQLVAPGEVDETQHLARVRVADGRRGTRPGLHDLAEVLGRGDLHRPHQGDGGARCVGPGRALVPRRALDEVHVLGPAPQHRMPLDPEKPCAGVAHRHQVPCLRRDPPQQLAEQRQQLYERAALPVAAQLRTVQLHRRHGPSRIDTPVAASPPGVGDDRPHPRRLSGVHEALVRPAQRC